MKGKLVMVDPRIGGSGQSTGAYVYAKYGRDTLKRLLVDQEMLLTKGNVEVAEQLVRGGRPLAVSAMSYDALIPFVNAGVPLNLEKVRAAALEYAIVGGSSPAVFKNPPHPNATKVFVNWLLSKAGQTLLATELKQNSARKDVPVGDPDTAPLPGADYLHLHKEVNAPLLREASQAARELVP